MSEDSRDILQVLKLELSFLELGGYGRSARTPWKWTSTFQHTPACINFNRPQRTEPCTQCVLIDFVPPEARTEDVPCHHIPIGPAGETVGEMESGSEARDLEEALKNWLRGTIQAIEQKRAQEMPDSRSA